MWCARRGTLKSKKPELVLVEETSGQLIQRRHIMPQVLLILPSTTYRAEAFLEAAQHLNLRVTVASERATGLGDRIRPDTVTLDFRDHEGMIETVTAFAREYPIDGVLGVDDVTVQVAAVIAAALGLPHNSADAVAAARNKHQMRERLRAHGLPIPRYVLCSTGQDTKVIAGQIPYPCVVKPTMLSASCGVIRANDRESFIHAYRRVGRLLERLGPDVVGSEGGKILVEEFVPGPELALEGLLTDGSLRVLALFDKPDPLDGPYFEETIYVTPSRHPKKTQQMVMDCAAEATKAIGLREGPIHGEFRVNERGVWVIEVAARSIGGRCSRALRFAAGMSLEELILRHLLRMTLPSHVQEEGAAGVMMLPIPYPGLFDEIRGAQEAETVPGIEKLVVTAQRGDELVPLPEGTRYLGFLFARGETPEFVESALREAHRRLDVVIRAADSMSGGTPTDQSGTRTVSF